jgi:Icc-related predicted phosphoesterase
LRPSLSKWRGDIKITLGRLEARLRKRREELFNHYKEICGYIKLKNLSTGNIETVNIEEYKKERGYKPLLSSLLPKQIVNISHKLPLKILAFSDYRIHDFEPLLDYVKGSGERPDLIIYAGDDIQRFGPLPIDCLILPREDGEYPKAIEVAGLRYEGDSLFSSSLGFILRIPRHLEESSIVEERLSKIRDLLHSVFQALHEGTLRSIDSLKDLTPKMPLQIVVNVIERKSIETMEKVILLIEASTGMEIYRMRISESGELHPEFIYDCNAFYEIYKDIDFNKLKYAKIIGDEKYVYYYIPNPKQSTVNVFEELALHTCYGVVAVAGNDDNATSRAWIRGERVYDLHTTLVKIGPVLIVGLEGSTCGMGPNGKYLESDVKLRLEFAQERVKKGEFILIVSHTPPRGILDRAMRFGEEAIGSLALRDFLEEEKRANLVVCGHVHRCGGLYEKLDGTTVVNVSSHDDPYSRANIAWITINPKGDVHVNFNHLPSLIEHIITKNGMDTEKRLIDDCHLSRAEAQLFIDAAKKFGIKFFDHLNNIATIKFKYGLSWKLALLMYEQGTVDINQLNEQSFLNVLPKISGLDLVHWKRAYVKFKRGGAGSELYLINPLPLIDNRIIVFDTEYNQDVGVLYGFLDFSHDDVKNVEHFWFNDKERASEYVSEKMRQNYVFVYWGGRDKSLLTEDLGLNPKTLNLLYYCQTSLVAPIDSAKLKDVHDVLCGHTEEEWWKTFFYDMGGIDKLVLCNRIVRDPSDESSRKQLQEANRADVIALLKILKALMKLPVKHPL